MRQPGYSAPDPPRGRQDTGRCSFNPIRFVTGGNNKTLYVVAPIDENLTLHCNIPPADLEHAECLRGGALHEVHQVELGAVLVALLEEEEEELKEESRTGRRKKKKERSSLLKSLILYHKQFGLSFHQHCKTVRNPRAAVPASFQCHGASSRHGG